MSLNSKDGAAEGGAPAGKAGAAPAALTGETKPIRVVLGPQAPPAPEAAPAPAASGAKPMSSLAGLLLGLGFLLGMLVSAGATVAFFVLACVLTLLHRDLADPNKPLEEYARLIPRLLEAMAHRLQHADGKVVLLLLMLAVVLLLVPRIVFGLTGAMALVTALYLLDVLDRPAGHLVKWLDTHEQSLVHSCQPLLTAPRTLLLATVSLFPAVHFLALTFLPTRPALGKWYPTWVAAGVVLLAGLLAWVGRAPPGKSEKGSQWDMDGRTLLVALLGLSLVFCGTGILLAQRLNVPWLSDQARWNGLGLAVVPLVVLWLWWKGYRGRLQSSQEMTGIDSAAAREKASWRYAAVAAATLAIIFFLMRRAWEVERIPWGRSGSAALCVAMLGAWFLGSRLQAGLVRTAAQTVTTEWVVVWLGALASVILCVLAVHWGGVWGLLGVVWPIVEVWRQGARLMREHHQAPPPGPTGPPTP